MFAGETVTTPKRAKTLDTVTLALELLRRIPRGRWVTAAALHEELKEAGLVRDLRTIQRLLEMLTARYGIERDDRSRPYGYRWKERAVRSWIRSVSGIG